MRPRPVSITIVGWLFVVTGAVGVVAAPVRWIGSTAPEDAAAHGLGDCLIAMASGVIAALGGMYALRGSNWARWLLVAWMAGHVVLGALHDTTKLLMHVAIFTPVLFLLFRRPASDFFRLARSATPTPVTIDSGASKEGK